MKVNTGYFGNYSYITLTKNAGNGKIHKTSNSDDTGSVTFQNALLHKILILSRSSMSYAGNVASLK